MQEVLNEELNGKQYDVEEIAEWTKSVSESIKEKLKGRLPYQIIVRKQICWTKLSHSST